MSEAAKAKAALEDVGKAAKDEGAVEVASSTAAAAAHKKDTEAIREETKALLEMAAAAKLANVQSLYGGRSSMEQHLSDEQSEVNLTNLLNRAKWLGFTTPQQAYSWRQQEYNQRLLMNRAEWAGYTTPDQYLQYLVKYRTDLDNLNSAMRARLGLFQESAVAANDLGRSISGLGGQRTDLGAQVAGINAFQQAVSNVQDQNTTQLNVDSAGGLADIGTFNAALGAVPDTNITTLSVDDARAISQIAQFDAIVKGIPDRKVTTVEVVQAAMGMGGAPVGGAVPIVPRPTDPANITRPLLVTQGGGAGGGGGPPPVIPAPAGAEPPRPGGGGGGGDQSFWTGLANALRGVSDAERGAAANAYVLSLAQQQATLGSARLAAADFTLTGAIKSENEAQSEQIALMKAADDAAGKLIIKYLQAGEAGKEALRAQVFGSGGASGSDIGGAGSVTIPAGVTAVAGGDGGTAKTAADYAALAAAANNAKDAYRYMTMAMLQHESVSAGDREAIKEAADALHQQAGEADNAKDAYRFETAAVMANKLATEETAKATKDAGDKADDASKKIGLMVIPLMGATKGWFGLGTQMTLWAGILPGIMGHVAVWHALLDLIIEAVAVLVPSLVTLTAGLAAFGLAGLDAATSVYNRFTALQTVANATGLSIAPLTGQLEKLHEQVRPMVWELYGDAMDVAATKNGLLNKLALDTGRAVDTMAARITVLFTKMGPGMSDFVKIGEEDLAKLGHAFYLLGDALMNLIKITQQTQIDQIFLELFVVLAKVLDLITKLPQPLLVAVVALHAFWLWGGLLATVLANLLGPIRAVSVALAGMSVEETALGSLGKDATGVQRFMAILTDLGAVFTGIPGKLKGTETAIQQVTRAMQVGETEALAYKAAVDNMGMSFETALPAGRRAVVQDLGKDMEQGSKDALAWAAGMGASDETLKAMAASTDAAATKTGLFSRLIGNLPKAAGEAAKGAEGLAAGEAGVAAEAGSAAVAGTGFLGVIGRFAPLFSNIYVDIALVAAAIGLVSFKLATMPDATQKWIASLNQAVDKASIFDKINTTVKALAQSTDELAYAQKTGTGNVTELAQGQQGLSDKLNLELTRVNSVAHAYGVDMVTALQLMNTAGVKANDLFTKQGVVWDADLQKIHGLVTGYKDMGQGLDQLQGDISVQLVSNQETLAQMDKINQAWDKWTTLVIGGQTTMVGSLQVWQSLTQELGKAGTSLDGLNSQSLAARNTYNQLIPNVGKYLDAVRNQNAALQDGQQGINDLTRVTKDWVTILASSAGASQQARDGVLAIAQQADPAINTWQKLTDWIGNKGVAGAEQDLNRETTKLETPLSNLQQDALKLTDSLQNDLTPAITKAWEGANNVQPAFNAFAKAIKDFGPNSQQARDAAQQVANILLAIEPNSRAAHDQFVAMMETWKVSGPVAEGLWKQVDHVSGSLKNLPPKVEIKLGIEAQQLETKIAMLKGQLKGATGQKKLNIEAEIKTAEDNLDKVKAKLGTVPTKVQIQLLVEEQDLNTKLANLKNQLKGATGTKKLHIEAEIKDTQQALDQVKGKLDIAGDSAGQLRGKIAGGSKAIKDLGSPGLWGQVEHAFMSVGDTIGRFFTGPFVNFFIKTIPGLASDVGNFFAGPFTNTIQGAWAHVWSALVSPVVHVFDTIKGAIVTGFDGWWKGHGDEVKQVWTNVTNWIKDVWNFTVGWLIRDAKTFYDGIVQIIDFVRTAWDGMFVFFHSSGLDKVFKGIWGGVVGVVKDVFSGIVMIAKNAWDIIAFAFKAMWTTAIMIFKIGWDTLVMIVSVILDLITGHWGRAWDDMKKYALQVWNALKTGFEGIWHDIENLGIQVWHNIWHFFDTVFVQPGKTFFTKTLPGWIGAIGGFFANAWIASWHWFDKHIIQNLIDFFTKKIPNWLWGSSLTSDFEHAFVIVWQKFDNNVIHPFIDFFTKKIPQWLSGLWSDFTTAWKNVWHDYDTWVNRNVYNWVYVDIPRFISHLGTSFLNLWKTVWSDFYNNVLTKFANWVTNTVPTSIKNAFKGAINWVIDNTINKVIGFLNNDVLKHLPGGLHVNTVGHVAAGGPIGMAAGGPFGGYSASPTGTSQTKGLMAGGGSIPGPSAIDHFPIMAMGGEYMLRQPARSAIDQTFGPAFLNRLNQADFWLGSGSRGTPASQGPQLWGNGYAVGGLVNPIGPGAGPARIDMGVDYTGAFDVYALGSGNIRNVYNSGWPGGTFIDIQLNPPYGTGYWYAAENIAPSVSVGQGVSAGQKIGHARGSYPFTEFGWATGQGGQTAAARDHQIPTSGDPGAWSTAWGVAASNLIHSLGGPAGIFTKGSPGGPGLLSKLKGFLVSLWQNAEGLLNAAGNAVSSKLAPVGRFITGGAGELLKLAKQGARAVIDAIWDHTVKPIVGLVPSDSLPGEVLQLGAAEMKSAIDSFFSTQDKNAQAQAQSQAGTPGNLPAAAGPIVAYAKKLLAAYGWSNQWPAYNNLEMHEAGYDPHAQNPHSTAYGIGQFLDSTWATVGGTKTSDPYLQLQYMMKYIKQRYGDPNAAWAQYFQHPGGQGSYALGGVVIEEIKKQTRNQQIREAMALGTYLDSGWNSNYSNSKAGEYGAFAQRASKAHPASTWHNIAKAVQLMMPRYQNGIRVVGPREWAATPEKAATSTADWAESRSLPKIHGQGAVDKAWKEVLLALGIKPTPPVTPGPKGGPKPAPPPWKPQPGQGPYPPGGYDAEDAWQLYSQTLLPQAVNAEIAAFWKLYGTKLPKTVKPADWASWYADEIIQSQQQVKAIGMGDRPAGDYMRLQEYFGRPDAIPASWWSSWATDLNTLVSWQGGPGVPGGMDPPSSTWHLETKGKWPKGFKVGHATPGHIKPMGYWGWKTEHSLWQDLRNKLLNLKKVAGIASSAWKELYAGAGQAGGILGPGTPGAQPAPPPFPGLEAIATIGGPTQPVIGSPGDAGYGFAAGGPVGPGHGVAAGQVVNFAEQFALGGPVPFMPPSALSFSFSGSPGGTEYPRALSPAGAAGRGIGLNVETMNINNPVSEAPSQSIARASNRLAFLAGRGLA
jgi:hypothetical protein